MAGYFRCIGIVPVHVFLSVVISPVCSILLLRAAFAVQLLLSPVCNGVGKRGNFILQVLRVHGDVQRNHLNSRGEFVLAAEKELKNG